MVEQARGTELQIQLIKAEEARTSGISATSGGHKRSHRDGNELSEGPAVKKSKQDEQSQHTSKPMSQFSSPSHGTRTKFMRPAPRQGMKGVGKTTVPRSVIFLGHVTIAASMVI